ncbi:baseplate J/gp47 family protein [Acinetobacter sp. TR11]|uniref:baseplate J/gp47 family protein n=1 Tax=Acinetobacter sp. TR11 TaxID=3003393 RepID=UPI0022AC7A11|nr:baseplate J/gp47 family protein [Acinetobacter sp. TR11]WAU72910.1 baseplate J/gp47 family protein [Acinetobacter sp. TR11]
MFTIPNFQQIRNTILQEIRGLTGINALDDSDAAIRADGTASAVDGLYSHQLYIQKQLFIATADEPYLYIHAEELGLPRLGGNFASGTANAISNVDLTINAGSKLTNGKGYYWSVANDAVLKTNVPLIVDVVADQKGAAWNYNGSLLWVSPQAGLSNIVTNVSIGSGSDQEELEVWRARLLERKQLGLSRDREADLVGFMNGVTGVQHVYVYPKRRGLGSLDVAITAVGNPPTLPSQTLLDAAQAALDTYAGFWADCRVYLPTLQIVNITAVVSGIGINLNQVEQVIRDYFAELAPADTYQVAILTARIVALPNVTDVTLTPSSNVVPVVDWMNTNWLRLGTLVVSVA